MILELLNSLAEEGWNLRYLWDLFLVVAGFTLGGLVWTFNGAIHSKRLLLGRWFLTILVLGAFVMVLIKGAMPV